MPKNHINDSRSNFNSLVEQRIVKTHHEVDDELDDFCIDDLMADDFQ